MPATWKWLSVCAVLALALLGTAMFAPRSVVLKSAGGGEIRATESAGPAWSDRLITLSAGGSNVFGVWKDFFDFPIFVYSFPDARRFLCVYDYDISILTFVVDCSGAPTNTAAYPHWPPDDYLRGELERGMTNVVVSNKGVVRLPTSDEIQEVSTRVQAWSLTQFKAASFPVVDLGFCSFRSLDKQFVLWAMATNRHDVWPRQ